MNYQRVLVTLTVLVAMTTVGVILHFGLGDSQKLRVVGSFSGRGFQMVGGTSSSAQITNSASHLSRAVTAKNDAVTKSSLSRTLIARYEGRRAVRENENADNQSIAVKTVLSNSSTSEHAALKLGSSKQNGTEKPIQKDSKQTSKNSDTGENSKPVSVPEKDNAKPGPTTNRPLTCKECFLANFTILLENTAICNESASEPVFIMMITTTHAAVDRRQAIRETWASVTKNNTGQVRHVFLLGTTNDEQATSHVMNESALFGDIVMADFVDVYTNLTLKTMLGLKWITAHCGQARFFLKTDQDMFIFVDHLLALFKKEENTLKTSLGGNCFQTGKPWRNPKTKYFASVQSYPQSTYPGFCSGTGYVGHMDLARKIVATSPNIPFFHLEDVYIALVLRNIGYHLKKYEGFATGTGICKDPARAKKAYTIHEVNPENMRKFWQEKCGQ